MCDALGATTHRHVDLQRAVLDLFADWTAGEVSTRRDRNLAIRLSAQRAAGDGEAVAAADAREAASVPGVVDLLARRRDQCEVLLDDLDDVFTVTTPSIPKPTGSRYSTNDHAVQQLAA